MSIASSARQASTVRSNVPTSQTPPGCTSCSTLYRHFSGAEPELADDEQLAQVLAGVWLRAIYGRVPDLG